MIVYFLIKCQLFEIMVGFCYGRLSVRGRGTPDEWGSGELYIEPSLPVVIKLPRDERNTHTSKEWKIFSRPTNHLFSVVKISILYIELAYSKAVSGLVKKKIPRNAKNSKIALIQMNFIELVIKFAIMG